ncbi:MAG: HAMP domain-containing histidine kinase [Clostridiales bacterium]|nr:HAMP domain-containing histidine kinase [Clostridiales bacterium]
MLRNWELLLFISGAAVVAVATALICQFSGMPPGVVCFFGCFLILAMSLVYAIRCYRSILLLIEYLQKVSQGENAPDIRDNAEGELSILKSEIYKVTAALAEHARLLAKDKAELANALADISHQLKTPLTAVGVMADLLGDEGLPQEKRRDFPANIRASVDRMEWLVLTLLKIARLDADAAVLKKEATPLAAIVERALSPLLIPIEIKGQNLTISEQDASVVCDPEWTAEALGNILKNAVENSPIGGEIAICCGSNPIYSYITVHNSGTGIDKADLPHVFQRFYHGKNASSNSAGIGLSMSLAIMRKQNGDIEAENDNGSVFTLKFYHIE